MTDERRPRDTTTLGKLLKQALRRGDGDAIAEVVDEMGPHIESFDRSIKMHGRTGTEVTIGLSNPSYGNGDENEALLKTIAEQMPVATGCLTALLIGIPATEIAKTVEVCLERLDARADFDAMATLLEFILKNAPALTSVDPAALGMRPVNTYRLNRVKPRDRTNLAHCRGERPTQRIPGLRPNPLHPDPRPGRVAEPPQPTQRP